MTSVRHSLCAFHDKYQEYFLYHSLRLDQRHPRIVISASVDLEPGDIPALQARFRVLMRR